MKWIVCITVFTAISLVLGQMYPNTKPNPEWNGVTRVDCTKSPDILSYHFHITYMFKQDQIDAVQLLRNRTQEHFAPFLGENPICQGTPHDKSGRFGKLKNDLLDIFSDTFADNGRICMIYDHDVETETLGPFAVGEWSMFVPVHYYHAVLPWFLMNRGDFSLLVHPNTGCEYEDHGIRAQWSGMPWQMYLDCCTPLTQTVEFGEKLGTERNPICLAKGGVCGFGDPNSNGYGPQVLCCSGSSCECASGDSQCYCK